MHFHKESKKAFIYPPKTGSTSLENFLDAMGWKKLRQVYMPVDVVVSRYPNLANYTIYGFLRNPLHRFESVILHLKRAEENIPLNPFRKIIEDKFGKPGETASYEDVVDVFPIMLEGLPKFFSPQSYLLNHPKVTVLDFDNYEAELRQATGNTVDPIPFLNVSANFDVPKSEITDKVRAFVREYYAADYALAKDRLGKEYNP